MPTKSKPTTSFWKHQNQSLAVYKKQARVYDTSDPGTGKTAVAIEQWVRRGAKKSMLVLCPKTLIKSAWINEAARLYPDLYAVACMAEDGRSGFEIDADIYVTNIDAVKWLAKQKAAFFKRFDSVVIDEHSAYKHRTSKRSKAAASIMKHFEYRAGLTGTPCPISVTEMWHQVYLLDDGKRLGNNFYRFQNEVCYPEQVGPKREHIKWIDKPGAHAAVASCIGDITIRHQFEECLDIPPNRMRYVSFEMSPKLRKVYDQMSQDAILILEKGDCTAVHAASLKTKLMQIASGAVYTQAGEWQLLDTGRYELVGQLIEERKHSVVFFMWTHQRIQMEAECTKRGIVFATIDGSVPQKRRDQIVADYQKGNLQTVLMHPDTGAHGLTLTRGTATIWCSPTSRADIFKQGNHRVYRGGQTKPTETICVHATNSLERKVYETREDRSTAQQELLGLLK